MILVTGGTGLVGSHLLYDLVSKGLAVRATRREGSDISQVEKVFSYYSPSYKELFAKIEWVNADVCDIHSLLEALDGVADVYHCAGFVSYDPKQADQILKINAEGTANMVNASLVKQVKKFCHVSSVAAFGDVNPGQLVNEEVFWKGCASYNHYSISKYNAEREVWRGTAEGLNAVIVNPAVIVGPGNWDMSSCVIFRESHKGLWFYPSGSAGYVDVRDVTKAMITLMESDISSERFILSAENFSLRDFANAVHDEMGTRRPRIRAGRLLLGLAWRLERIKVFFTMKPPVITKTIAHAVDSQSAFSSDKLRQRLSFAFIPIKQSVKDTAAIFLKERGEK